MKVVCMKYYSYLVRIEKLLLKKYEKNTIIKKSLKISSYKEKFKNTFSCY